MNCDMSKEWMRDSKLGGLFLQNILIIYTSVHIMLIRRVHVEQ